MDRSFCTIKNDTGEATAYHGRVIGYLFDNRDKDIFQKDIENRFGIRRSTVTKLLQLMEGNGLITRTAVLSDARLKKITLTEKGISMHEHFRCEIDRFEQAVSAGLTPEERESFFRITDKIYKNIIEQERNDTKKC